MGNSLTILGASQEVPHAVESDLAYAAVLHKRHPDWSLPHRATGFDILNRHGLIRKKPKRRHVGHPGKPSTLMLAPNQVWCADFKGHFRMGNGEYCYPLTVSDGHSRYLFGCRALHSTAVMPTKAVFTRVFKDYGLPERIRSDNGVPFATNSPARLSTLPAWVDSLGRDARSDRARQAAAEWAP